MLNKKSSDDGLLKSKSFFLIKSFTLFFNIFLNIVGLFSIIYFHLNNT